MQNAIKSGKNKYKRGVQGKKGIKGKLFQAKNKLMTPKMKGKPGKPAKSQFGTKRAVKSKVRKAMGY